MVQLKVLFQVLPMVVQCWNMKHYMSCFASLGVQNNTTMHWSNFVVCIFLQIMHIQVKNVIVKAI